MSSRGVGVARSVEAGVVNAVGGGGVEAVCREAAGCAVHDVEATYAGGGLRWLGRWRGEAAYGASCRWRPRAGWCRMGDACGWSSREGGHMSREGPCVVGGRGPIEEGGHVTVTRWAEATGGGGRRWGGGGHEGAAT